MALDISGQSTLRIKKKKVELDMKLCKMYWLIGRKSALLTENKILLYNQVINQVWTYGIQLWRHTSQKNIETIQRFQNKVLRMIVNAPWYICNTDLYRDLGIKTVAHEIQRFANTPRFAPTSACKRRSFQTYSKRQPRQTTKKSKT